MNGTTDSPEVSDPFSTIQRFLIGEIKRPDLQHYHLWPDHYRRLLDALEDRANSFKCGAMDLAGLFRHVLRAESVSRGVTKPLRVPASDFLPDPAQFNKAGIHVTATDHGSVLSAEEWRPAWLSGSEAVCPEEAAFGALSGVLRRQNKRVPSDGFVQEIFGFTDYVTAAQRQAVRSALAMAPGSTLLVNLPTGSGKSLVEGAGAVLQARDSGGVSVVVVPTISLAQDQERAMFENSGSAVLPERLAYFGSQLDQEREGIRQRIREGTQTVVFASPESILSSLLPSIYVASRKGLLKYFVIDEAHTVASWGAEFRPEFQALAGLRLGLLDSCKENDHELFRTLLMSATLSVDSVRLLQQLFGDPGPFLSVVDPVLRPEPEFWVAEAGDREEQRGHVLEAIHYLPRPLVVYSTLPDESKHLRELASQIGYLRTDLVTGATPPGGRAEVMARWRGESPTGGRATTSVDIVFATSAFGLGVDYAGVRAVVHACIPETIDRFYQEVGRGGRDGRPSISLLIHAPEDREVATGLNRNLLIGTRKGRGRWETMLARSEEVTSDPLRIRVDLRTVPSWIQRASRENEAWNLRTLLLMSRAGLLMLDALPPPTMTPQEKAHGNESEEVFDAYFGEQVVRLLQPTHLSEQTWTGVIGDVRSRSALSDATQLSLMFETLNSETDFADLFARAYESKSIAQPSCGGCPNCRKQGRLPYAGLGTFPDPIPTHFIFPSELAQISREAEITFVTHGGVAKGRERERWLRDRLEPLVIRLVGRGIVMIRAASDLLRRPAIRNAHERSAHRYVFSQDLNFDPSVIEAPSVVIADLDGRTPREDLWWACTGKPSHPRIVVIHESQVDPIRPTRRLVETRAGILSLDELLRSL